MLCHPRVAKDKFKILASMWVIRNPDTLLIGMQISPVTVEITMEVSLRAKYRASVWFAGPYCICACRALSQRTAQALVPPRLLQHHL